MPRPKAEVNTAGNAPPAVTHIATTVLDESLGTVIDRATDGERFVVTRHGRERVVMLAKRDYDDLLRRAGYAVAAAVA